MLTPATIDVRAVTVVVADDHPLCVAGLQVELDRSGDLTVVACCYDGAAALAALQEYQPDVAVLDMRMPMLNADLVLREVIGLELPTRVVICSIETDPVIVHAVMRAGARGYMDKTAPVHEICTAVRTVIAGRRWISPSLRDAYDAQVLEPQRALSLRERQALGLVEEGCTDREIGTILHVSPETVRTILNRCREKLGGPRHRAALARTARKRGLL